MGWHYRNKFLSPLFIQRSIEKDQLSGPILCQNYMMRFWLERGAAKHKKCISLGINSSQKWQILLHKSLFFGHEGDILWIGTDYEIFCRKLKQMFSDEMNTFLFYCQAVLKENIFLIQLFSIINLVVLAYYIHQAQEFY